MTDNQKKWFKAAGIRALKTFLQVAAGFITVGAAISDIKWGVMFSTAFVAGLYSLVTSVITGLPEAPSGFKEEEDNNNGPTDT